MKIISRPRGGGKTYDAVNLCRETGAHLIVHNISEARRVLTEYPDMHGMVLDYSTIMACGLNGIRNVVIDNIELFLQNLLRTNISAITTNYKTYTTAQYLTDAMFEVIKANTISDGIGAHYTFEGDFGNWAYLYGQLRKTAAQEKSK
jgi:hypothetical protein